MVRHGYLNPTRYKFWKRICDFKEVAAEKYLDYILSALVSPFAVVNPHSPFLHPLFLESASDNWPSCSPLLSQTMPVNSAEGEGKIVSHCSDSILKEAMSWRWAPCLSSLFRSGEALLTPHRPARYLDYTIYASFDLAIDCPHVNVVCTH